MTQSGLKINDEKTDLCIFHRRALETRTIEINETEIKSANQINILGLIFDINLKWEQQYDQAIKAANHNLHVIIIISKYFNAEEKKTLLTSLFLLQIVLWL